MKGQTIIELNNIKTGQKERYVDNNMVTNALAEYFANGGFMNTPNVPKDALVVNMLGGLLLFDDNIQENANNIFPPSAINMIGNGCNGVMSSDAVTEMGSYNTNESGWQSDGSYVQVWDYNTAQANGTIACACLTSNVGGFIGWGNGTSNAQKYRQMSRYAGSLTPYIYSTQQSLHTFLKVDYTSSNCMVAKSSQFSYNSEDFVKTTGKLNIEVRNIPLTKLNLKTTTASMVKERDISIDLPSAFLETIPNNTNVSIYYGYEDDVYLSATASTWANNATKVFLKINISNNSIELINLINTTGVTLNISNAFFKFADGYLFLQNNTSSGTLPYMLFRIKVSDNTVTEITNFGGYYLAPSNVVKAGDYLFNLSSGGTTIIDIKQGTFKRANRVFDSGYFFGKEGNIHSLANGGKLFRNIPYSESGNALIGIYRFPIYLATINNLETPVTKTPEKTMKVTYRLTF